MKKEKRNRIIMIISIVLIILWIFWFFAIPAIVQNRITYNKPVKKFLCEIRTNCVNEQRTWYCVKEMKIGDPKTYQDIIEISEYHNQCIESAKMFKGTPTVDDRAFSVILESCMCYFQPFSFG